jgi:hypothetical protein
MITLSKHQSGSVASQSQHYISGSNQHFALIRNDKFSSTKKLYFAIKAAIRCSKNRFLLQTTFGKNIFLSRISRCMGSLKRIPMNIKRFIEYKHIQRFNSESETRAQNASENPIRKFEMHPSFL